MKSNTLLCLIFLIICACQEDDKPALTQSGAIILGPESSVCECCEGTYRIEIEGDQYRFYLEELPEHFRFFLNTTDLIFPLPVTIHWKAREHPCGNHEILIKKIALIQASPLN